MRSIIWSVPTVLCLLAGIPALAADQARINPTDPQPTCTMCPGTYIPSSEIDAYANKALAEKLLDQQVRDIDIGKAHIGIGMVHRGKLDKPAPDSVAEHDQISEVYHVLSGSATLVLGPDIVNRQRRRRPCARWSSSTVPATTAPRCAMASLMRSRLAMSS